MIRLTIVRERDGSTCVQIVQTIMFIEALQSDPLTILLVSQTQLLIVTLLMVQMYVYSARKVTY